MTPQLLADVKTNAYLLRGKAALRLAAQTPSLLTAARADFEAARQPLPNSPLPHVNLADAAAAERKWDEAWQHLDQALALDRDELPGADRARQPRRGHRTPRRGARARRAVSQRAADNAQLQYLLGNAYRNGSQQDAPDPQRAEAVYAARGRT